MYRKVVRVLRKFYVLCVWILSASIPELDMILLPIPNQRVLVVVIRCFVSGLEFKMDSVFILT